MLYTQPDDTNDDYIDHLTDDTFHRYHRPTPPTPPDTSAPANTSDDNARFDSPDHTGSDSDSAK